MKQRTFKSFFKRSGQGNYLVFLQLLWVFAFLAVPAYPAISPDAFWKSATIFRYALLALFWSSALLMGTLGVYHLRKYLTPLPYPVEHNQLVTTSIYSLVRHPLYSSQLFAAFGWSVFSMSLSHLLLTLVGALFFNFKASHEERWLTERHPEYCSYSRQVKKFIPWIY
jgi:protein-S-isoprenylcysteine O-methyltransferase Ste14